MFLFALVREIELIIPNSNSRLQLFALFSLGILLLIIAILRLPIYSNGTSQVRRYTWGSVEQFSAALVANLPTLYALRKDKPTEQNANTNVSTIRSLSKGPTPRSCASETELIDWHFAVASQQRSRLTDCATEYGEVAHEAAP